MSKLSLLHINIIGVVVLLIVGAALYFTVIQGAQQQITKNETDQKEVFGRAEQLDKAKSGLKEAQEDKAKNEADWKVYDAKYIPNLGYSSNPTDTMMRVFWPNNGRSWPERFIHGVRAHMNSEQKTNGVVWLNPEVLALPAYGPNPNAITFGPVLTYSYLMQVRGKDYNSLMRHVYNWPTITGVGVPVVDGVSLAGNSPHLDATYNLSFTVIVRDTLPTADPKVGGGDSGRGGGVGGPGGGMGGRGGMMMGGPGGGGMMGPGPGGGAPGGSSAGMGAMMGSPGGGTPGGKAGGAGGKGGAE